jgi:putative transposase
MRGYARWRWHLDEVFVKVNGKLYCLWRAQQGIVRVTGAQERRGRPLLAAAG